MTDRQARRPTLTTREIIAGCYDCKGTTWKGPNAQALAARHHDASGHSTWCNVVMQIRYGDQPRDDRQLDIEDAIGGAVPA